MIECCKCKQCNRKGKPSVTRDSAYCQHNRIDNKILRLGFFSKLKEKIFWLQHPENKPDRKKGGFRW